MSARTAVALNYALYQIGWLATVGGAAIGWGGSGAAIAAVLTVVHVWLARDRSGEATLVCATLMLGVVVEVGQIAAGTYVTLGGAGPSAWPPAWLLCLWGQFATTFRFSASGLFARAWAAALFGAFGGPLAFLAGERLGAVTLARPMAPSLLRLLVAWALAMTVCAWLVRLVPARSPSTYRQTALATST